MIGKIFKRINQRLLAPGEKSNSAISKSGLSTDHWVWERVDEYSYEHYTEAIEDIKQLKREKSHDQVEDLLLWCIDFAEAEAKWEKTQGYEFEIPPAYYRHLAIVYRKDDRYGDEVSVLERYQKVCSELNQSPKNKMVNRLERAYELEQSQS